MVLLDLERTTTRLLENPLFSMLAEFVEAYSTKHPDTKSTMVETLTQRFGDRNVAKMLVAAKAEDETKDVASKLESAQLKMWLSSGKSVDDVYRQLKLYDAVHGFDHDPLLSTWVSYMNTVIMENTSKTSAMFSALDNRFSDRSLTQIFEAAKKFPSMETIAKKMQMENIQRIFDSKTSPRKVFEAVGLGDDETKVLGNPLFKKWLNYVEIFNKENPNHQESWFMPLHFSYQWDGIERMIKKAEENPSTLKIAQMMEKVWIREWLDRWKKLPEHAFKFLALNKAGETTLSSPKFKTWVQYLDDFNHRYPDQKTTMIDSIRANYNDREVLEILNAAKKDPITKKLAADLEEDLFNKWLVAKKDPASQKQILHLVPNIDEIVKRYSKKLTTLSENTS